MKAQVGRRINRPEFIELIAAKTGVDVATVKLVLAAIETSIVDIVVSGDSLLLRGFGKFFPRMRVGHPVQFLSKDDARVTDYPMLRFSPASQVSKKLREHD